jgi:hypothetical protein
MDNKKISIIVVVVLGLLIGFYLLTPEARSMPFSVSYQDPVYRTDNYQDPVYGTLYSGTIGNYGLTGQTWTINDASSVSSTYTGNGFWGGEYTYHICWSTICNDYYKIQFNNLKLETKITGYETKTRQVIDHFETKYRTEYKDVTKSRLEWIFS